MLMGSQTRASSCHRSIIRLTMHRTTSTSVSHKLFWHAIGDCLYVIGAQIFDSVRLVVAGCRNLRWVGKSAFQLVVLQHLGPQGRVLVLAAAGVDLPSCFVCDTAVPPSSARTAGSCSQCTSPGGGGSERRGAFAVVARLYYSSAVLGCRLGVRCVGSGPGWRDRSAWPKTWRRRLVPCSGRSCLSDGVRGCTNCTYGPRGWRRWHCWPG
jgi:hypothetical protein